MRVVLVLVLALAAALAVAQNATAAALSLAGPPLAGTWRSLPDAPIAPEIRVSVWTGSRVLVFGRSRQGDAGSLNVAAAYDPAADTWTELAPPPGPTGSYEGRFHAVWTGEEMLVWGPFTQLAYNPLTEEWRELPPPPGGASDAVGAGIVVWTGHEMIGWGGGCCGEAFDFGLAYSPAGNSWRVIADSPLAGRQSPQGTWTGRELLILGGTTVDEKPARGAAAYDPATDTWRRIAPLPAPRTGAVAVWDGHEVLVVGGTGVPRGRRPPKLAKVGLAYDPATNRWRRLPPTESGRLRHAAVWTGTQLLVWGGRTNSPFWLVTRPARTGLAYHPDSDRWSRLPEAPLPGRLDPAAVWTGGAMIVWGGESIPPRGPPRFLADGAVFTPAA